MSAKRGRLGLVWALLLALVAVIVYVEFKDRAEEAKDDGHGHAAGNRNLIPVPVAELGSIEIAYEGQLHRFERDPAGKWFYHGPHAGTTAGHEHQFDPALSEQIGKAFGMLDHTRMEREAPFDKDKDLFGVVVPKMIIVVYKIKETQPLAQFAVGDLASDGLTRYVHLVGTNKVITLPQYHIDNLLAVIKRVSPTVPLALPAPAK